MDERREPPPRPIDHAPIPVGRARLSRVQEAWGAYVEHTLYRCDTCRRVDGSPCVEGEQLHAAFKRLGDDATNKLWES